MIRKKFGGIAGPVRRLLFGPSCAGEVVVRDDATGYVRPRMVERANMFRAAALSDSTRAAVACERYRLARYAMPLSRPPRGYEATAEFLGRLERDEAAMQWVRSGHAEVRTTTDVTGEVRRWVVLSVFLPERGA